MKNLSKSFKKVWTVRFTNDDFRCKPADLNRCFPNLSGFAMRNSNAVDCILVHIPKLDCMDINVYGNQHDKLATVLQLNPQLRRLSIFGNGLNLKFLRSLNTFNAASLTVLNTIG